MKKQMLILLAVCSVFTGRSQEPAFSNVSIQEIHGRVAIVFTIARETNVRHYRIEASNDSETFEVINTVPSKGNTVFRTNYSFDITAYPYAYYRIGAVAMNGQMPYSVIVNKIRPASGGRQAPPVCAPKVIVNK